MTTYTGNWKYSQPQKNAREAIEECWKPLCMLDGFPLKRKQIRRMYRLANERLAVLNNTNGRIPALNQSLEFIEWPSTIYIDGETMTELGLDELLNELVIAYTRKIKEI